ncbi:serine hydrolase domain-containing protein [Fructilactobacillus florum]|uniref:Beta-lactamase-related domain-containing protein n=2 Tax=Fructilactobacillus florum TaxID=640331 RepID=A0A0R2CM04_9LACO|nr:serine hydrolase domain-containing protein [Fructilactobacillus florum]KRM92471.1 hypothetical protein FC87_GL000083 [Fructilactobacillus florum DSM 22689 = JCM 16035]
MNLPKTTGVLAALTADQLVPGVSYAFIQGQQTSLHYHGKKSWDPVVTKLLPEQLYDVASLTKVVGTVPVILRLIEQNRLHLDDSLTTYLPEWHAPRVTIRHLLTHTADIRGYIPNRDRLNAQELKTALLGLSAGPLLGNQMHYQDANFIFLGWVATKITGLPIQSLISQMVLQPLGMHDSTFQPDPKSSVPTTYDPQTHTNLAGRVHDPKARVLGENCGSAGLFSSLCDLVHFMQWMLQIRQPGVVLTPATLDRLSQDQTPMQDGGRSFGWQLNNFNGQEFLSQTGYTGTMLVLVPQLQSGLVLLSNRVHPVVGERYLWARERLLQTYLAEIWSKK